ncbi:NHLP leader peptide family RiPP precursor [Aquimarina longa]|uniref:NHLP leader peptide family RiPP precursor n=1 Tax=Aquimarina longa TaxID=1080221 RepID=UPI000780D2CF|nr:NHLP leader peptide family RiPP precursor [Aquimarina longa]
MRVTLEQRKENKEILSSIFQKCWKNEEFKSEFIEDPKKVLEEEKCEKVVLPEWKNKIVVEDQTDSSVIYLNIPANEELDVELTDKELKLVSGGVVCGGVCLGIIFVASAVIGWVATE